MKKNYTNIYKLHAIISRKYFQSKNLIRIILEMTNCYDKSIMYLKIKPCTVVVLVLSFFISRNHVHTK